MPIKRLFKSTDKDVNIESLMKKVDVLESEVKKLKTVDLHLKRILDLEKTLKLYELREKQDLNASADRIGKLQKKTPKSFGNPDMNKHSDRVDWQESGTLKPFQSYSDEKREEKTPSAVWTRTEEMEQRIRHLEAEGVKQQEQYTNLIGLVQQQHPHWDTELDKDFIETRHEWVTQLICKELEPFKQQMESLNHKIYGLEVGLEELKTEVSISNEKQKTDHGMEQEPVSKISEESKVNNGPASVIYQDIKIEKVYLDRYEQNNNFAQLGIKELGGQLNIGATYGSGTIPEEVKDQYKEAMESMKDMKEEFGAEKDTKEEFEAESNETQEDN